MTHKARENFKISEYIPDREHLGVGAVSTTLNTEPVPTVVDCMCRIASGLENYPGLDTSGSVVVGILNHDFIVLVPERVVCHARAEARHGRAGGGLEFTRALPFRSA
jgi:hypothetical protein